MGEGRTLTLRPKLRAIEVVHYRQDEQDMFLLRDPLQFTDSQLHVSPDVFMIASLFDGEHDFSMIVGEFEERFGVTINEENIRKVMEALDDAFMLEGPRFEEHREEIEREYRDAPVREAVLAGSCYPEDRRDVGEYLDRYFVHEDGPGMPAERSASAAPLRALIVPHIDIRRGGEAFAHAYRELLEARPPETIIMLGTAHAGRGERFTFTRKNFKTPLGTVQADTELIDRLAAAAGDRAYADEYVHKGEHSIEIQLPWLQYYLKFATPKIVPILCGSMADAVETNIEPRDLGATEAMVKEIAKIVSESDGRVMVMASADLAHIGQKFGDQVPLTPRLLRKNEDCDLRMLDRVTDGDADAFFAYIKKEEDRRHVCGLSAIYLLLASLTESAGAACPGRLLYYAQSPEDETQSLVSYASVVFE